MSFLSFQYVIVLMFLTVYSIVMSVTFIKHIVFLVYVAALIWTAFTNYNTLYSPNILQMVIIAFILLVMQTSQAYLLGI
jgi:hypothetical protein